MNSVQRIFMVLMILLGGKQVANAHAVWIESNPVASLHQKQTVQIFFGEFEKNEIDPVASWYSDLKDLEVWLTNPDQTKTKLIFTAKENYLEATFTPQQEGRYTVSTVHAAKDLGGKTKYEFAAVSLIQVGKKSANQHFPEHKLPLAITTAAQEYKKGEQLTLKVMELGQVVAHREVEISTKTGWTKKFQTNEAGEVSFMPEESGVYMAETSKYQAKEGNWHGNTYTHEWIGSTVHFQVK